MLIAPRAPADHFEARQVDPDRCQRSMVVDEADRMPDIGVHSPISNASSGLDPFTRQTLFFSATQLAPRMSDRITTLPVPTPARSRWGGRRRASERSAQGAGDVQTLAPRQGRLAKNAALLRAADRRQRGQAAQRRSFFDRRSMWMYVAKSF